MKTMLLSLPVAPGTSPAASIRLAAKAWTAISARDRLRFSPPCPVAQKGHAIPQPAWELMHRVERFG